jgi:hypothetical protein
LYSFLSLPTNLLFSTNLFFYFFLFTGSVRHIPFRTAYGTYIYIL